MFLRSRILSRALTTARPAITPRYAESIKSRDETINAFVSIAPDPAGETEDLGLPLALLPIAIKDNICTSVLPTTCSSSMLSEFKSPFDATVVELLQSAGATIVGKTNCDEFGMGSNNVHSAHGPVVNPFQDPSSTVSWKDRERRSAGGSSGGSAAAVASGTCYAALSTDTGGSTRLPASYCGIVGLKPSYGTISRWGVVSYADSLDCVGIMANDVTSVESVFNVLAQYDPKDPTSALPEVRSLADRICSEAIQNWDDQSTWDESLKGVRIGIPQEYFPSEIQPSILHPLRNVLSELKSLGATLVPVSLPSTQYALSAYYVIASAEASSNLARYDGVQYGKHVPPSGDVSSTADIYAATRTEHFGSEVKRRILLGTYALTADAFDNYFLKAQQVREMIKDDFNAVFRIANPLSAPPSNEVLLNSSDSNQSITPKFEGVDLLIHLSAIGPAPLLAQLSNSSQTQGTNDDGTLDSYVQDVLTVPASLAGLPAMSVPAGLSGDESIPGRASGWPVGISIIGQWGCDRMVMALGKVIDNVVRPPLEASGPDTSIPVDDAQDQGQPPFIPLVRARGTRVDTS